MVGPEIASFPGNRIPAGHWHRLLDPVTNEPTSYTRLVGMREAADYSDEIRGTYRDAVEAGKVTDCEGCCDIATLAGNKGRLSNGGQALVSVTEGGSEGHYVHLTWVDWSSHTADLLISWKVLTGEQEAETIARWVRNIARSV